MVALWFMRCVEMHELKDACENPQHDARECRREPIGNSQGNISGKYGGTIRKRKGTHGECTGNARGMQDTKKCNGVTD